MVITLYEDVTLQLFISFLDCRSSTAIEEVMKRCHGRNHCVIEAEEYVFGNPCPPGVQKYLTLSYTCGRLIYLMLSYTCGRLSGVEGGEENRLQ